MSAEELAPNWEEVDVKWEATEVKLEYETDEEVEYPPKWTLTAEDELGDVPSDSLDGGSSKKRGGRRRRKRMSYEQRLLKKKLATRKRREAERLKQPKNAKSTREKDDTEKIRRRERRARAKEVETPEEREARLEKIRQQRRNREERETPEQRQKRREALSLRARERRAAKREEDARLGGIEGKGETAEQGGSRSERARETRRKKFANATPEWKEKYLEGVRQQRRKREANETPERRAKRLEMHRLRQRQRRCHQRLARQRERGNVGKERKKETSEEREKKSERRKERRRFGNLMRRLNMAEEEKARLREERHQKAYFRLQAMSEEERTKVRGRSRKKCRNVAPVRKNQEVSPFSQDPPKDQRREQEGGARYDNRVLEPEKEEECPDYSPFSPPSSPAVDGVGEEEDPTMATTPEYLEHQCEFCPESFSTDTLLRSHLVLFHRDKCWECPKCPQVLLSPKEFTQHYSSSHKNLQIPEEESSYSDQGSEEPSEGEFLCLKCSNKVLQKFRTRENLFAHVEQHHFAHFWPCRVCHLLKYSEKALILHYAICGTDP